MTKGPFRELSAAEVAAISKRNRASRTHRLLDEGKVAPTPSPAPADAPERVLASHSPIPGVSITLPWPPTVNHYWKLTRTGKVYIGEPGRAFRAKVKMKADGLPLTKGRVSVTLLAYPPDKRRRDLDNICKAVLDALQHADLITDDSLIDCLLVERRSQCALGRVEVTIQAME